MPVDEAGGPHLHLSRGHHRQQRHCLREVYPLTPGKYTVTIELRDALDGVTQLPYTPTVKYRIKLILVFRQPWLQGQKGRP